MPRITQITSQVGPGVRPGLLPTVSAEAGMASARAAQAEASAMRDVGQALAGVGTELREIERKQAQWDAQLQYTEFQTEWAQEYQNLRDSAEPGAEGFTDNAVEAFETAAARFMENAPESDTARRQLQQQLAELRGNTTVDAMGFQAKERARDQTMRTERAVDGKLNQARANPGARDQLLKEVDTLVDTMLVPDTVKSALRDGFRVQMYDSALDGQVADIEKNASDIAEVDAFIQQLEQGELGFRENSSPPAYDAAISRLYARREEVDTENKALWNKDRVDALTDLTTRGATTLDISKERVQALYPDDPAMVERTLGEFEWARQSYNWRQQTRLSSPAEDQALLADIDARTAGRGAQYKEEYKRRFQQELGRKYQQIQDDAVRYLLTNSSALAQSYQQAQDSGDPGDMADVLAKMAAAQTKLGLPGHRHQYLGKGAATKIVDEITDPQTNAEQAVVSLQTLKQRYGDKWPNVLRELRTNGLKGSVSTAARLDTEADVGISKRLMQGVKAGGSAELAKNLQPSQVSELNNDIKDYMAGFRESLHYAGPMADKIIADELEAARVLAYQYVTKDGLDESTAAERAFEELLGNRYDFDEGYRTPKGMAGLAGAFAADLQAKLTPDQFEPAAVGPNTDPALAEFGNEDYRRRAAWSNAVNNGVWVNNETGDGLLLMVPDDTTSSAYSPLRLKDGNRVEMTFDEMRQKGIPDSAYRRFGGMAPPTPGE